MGLGPGTRLGAYEILSLLGSGGMGEVYRAHDPRLKRDVAIKVLPASFARDPDRIERFDREAQLLASLNHPHIGAIYGVEEADGVFGLVLELIEGETLEERLSRGAVRVEDALAIAAQIASALEAAHEKGVIHRDLKPANVKCTAEGVTKVLDFGLARSTQAADVGRSQSPTMRALTGEGTVLGTVTFMSPEQARGRPVDRATDIWAFGCVLYQMLAGRPPFDADTQADMIAAILHREPAWDRLSDATPLSVRRLVRRCLQKDPRRRLCDIGDARIELDETVAGVPDIGADGPVAQAPRDVRFRRLTDFIGLKESPAISPDGKMVAFVSLADGTRQITIRLVAGGMPLQVTRDPVDHEHPRWAADSSAILFYSASEAADSAGVLWEVSAFGGPPRRVATSLGGGDISHDGRRVALFRPVGDHVELAVVARDNSRVDAAIQLPASYVYTTPRWSPDDRWVACQRANLATFGVAVCVAPAAGGEMREVVRGSWLRGLCWLPDGSGLAYSSSRGSTMLYPPVFNLRAVSMDGSRDRQLTFGDVSYLEPDANGSGTLVATRMRIHSDIWRFPIGSSPVKNTRAATRITRQTGQAQAPSVAPDGRRIAYLSDSGGHSNVWVTAIDGSDARQITFEEDPAVTVGLPQWAPAGNRIAFLIGRGGDVQLWLVAPDGSGLRQATAHGWYPNWSPDGQWLYYTSTRGINQIEKIRIAEETPIQVRGDGYAPAAGTESALYYIASVRPETPKWGDLEIRRAQPEDGASTVLARIAGARVPMAPMTFAPSLSPDGRWLAAPLIDGSTTNVWMLSTGGGAMQPVTDFGERSVLITRHVSWSSDSRFLYAAVADIDGDVVLLNGLLP